MTEPSGKVDGKSPIYCPACKQHGWVWSKCHVCGGKDLKPAEPSACEHEWSDEYMEELRLGNLCECPENCSTCDEEGCEFCKNCEALRIGKEVRDADHRGT